MKKGILALFLIILLVPSIASAVWWNPFSWKIFQKKEPVAQTQIEIPKTPEEKINELQEQLNELKKQQSDSAPDTITIVSTEAKKVVPKTDNSTNTIKSTQVVDICSNVTGIQTTTPVGYSWSYGNICSVINLTDYCPNISGVQSNIPNGMFIYGSSKECLTQNEISYIANKMAEERNKEIALEIKSNDPIYSEECIDAQAELKEINAQEAKMNQTDYSALADFVVLKVNPALNKVNSACRLETTMPKLEPTKSTNCYVSYYGSNANVNCYSN